MANQQVKITLVKSPIGRSARHRATLRCLGLNKLHQSVMVDDSPTVKGKINSISYMLKIESPAEGVKE